MEPIRLISIFQLFCKQLYLNNLYTLTFNGALFDHEKSGKHQWKNKIKLCLLVWEKKKQQNIQTTHPNFDFLDSLRTDQMFHLNRVPIKLAAVLRLNISVNWHEKRSKCIDLQLLRCGFQTHSHNIGWIHPKKNVLNV